MRNANLAYLSIAATVLGLGGCAITPAHDSSARREPAARTDAAAIELPAPSMRYSTGRAVQDFSFPSARVAVAVREAMDDLGMTITRHGQDGVASQVVARTSDGRTVTVTLRPDKPITRVTCRIGWFGDEPMARTFMRRVGVRLGTLPPEAVPDRIPSQPASNPYFSRSAVPDVEMMRDFYEAPYRTRPDM